MIDEWNGWKPIADLPEWNQRHSRMFIRVTGWKEHHGSMWGRSGFGIAWINKDGRFGFRDSDIELLRKDFDMDAVDAVTHWKLLDLNFPHNLVRDG